MIVVTGASGKTGEAVVRALAGKEGVRALVRRPEQAERALAEGADEARVADLADPDAMVTALKGARAVYLICPNMHPGEVDLARGVIAAAKSNHLERLVYHSVLHPQVEAMPHHWAKMRVEELLFTSGLNFTILQPCAYMQNVLGYWPRITLEGVYPVLYAPTARMSMVDLHDVAWVAARVLCEDGHAFATYELAGPEPLSQDETAGILAEVLERPVEARREDTAAWAERIRAGGMDDYGVATLLKMFAYYDQNGFTGSSMVLEMLLNRPAVRFAEFLRRMQKE